MEEQIKWSFEIDCVPGEDDGKIIEMTTQGLEYYIHLLYKAVQGLRKLTPVLKGVLLWVNLSNSIASYREIICERQW